MGKSGKTYYSAERLARIVAQAKVAGRRELVDELRKEYGPITRSGIGKLEMWLDGYAAGYQVGNGNPTRMQLFRNDLRNVQGMFDVLDQEVIDAPGF